MTASTTALMSWLQRAVPATPRERSATLWSFAYFFCLLAGYYVLRPLRDEMGIAGGVRNLQWMFTATFAVMLAAVPVFGWTVASLPRRRFIPAVYHFFVLNIAIFWVLLTLRLAVLCARRLERAAPALAAASGRAAVGTVIVERPSGSPGADASNANAAAGATPAATAAATSRRSEGMGGSWLAGLAMVLRSPYL